MGKLLESCRLFGLTLRTRTVRSATWEGLADEEGFVRPELIEMLVELARGNVGLIIPGYLYISPEGRGLPWQTGVWDDAHVEGLKRMIEAVHEKGAVIAAQIAHAGGRTRPSHIGGERPMAPSAVEGFAFGDTPRQMTLSEIQAMIHAFAQAARRVKEAGFDAVQLHAAHGYLLSQFLSPLLNRRSDAYGGTPEKRRRFVIEVYESVREAVGDSFPVFIKLNTMDGPQGGITIHESLDVARDLESRGLNGVEVSGGRAGSKRYRPSWKGISDPSKEAYFRPAARLFKEELDIPVILVGGIKSYEVAEDILVGGYADFVSFSRALICEPHLILRWHEGDMGRSKCVSCNLCLKEGLKGSGIACAADEKAQEVDATE
ncbi:MAG: NADH:flavin oxidoreductase [Deltaproteobacteria bacterium]|nr:NADH:flavin oxidoreductase [Deltaproteobacteria bacterium]MBW2049271.1 NADH:flavin oxidoreductase [Deltaproteobacteria bacterium]